MVQIAGVELQTIMILVGALAALGLYGLKWYRDAKADGKISLSEIIDAVEGGEELVDDVVDAAEKVKAEKVAAEAEKRIAEAKKES